MDSESSLPVVDAATADLPATSWAVLGILSFGEELSGYDIKQWADQSLAFFYWAPSQSQIYTELRRLEAMGLATSRVDQTHSAKSRRLYAITAEGRRCMQQWSDRRPAESLMLKHAIVLRLWAAHNGDVALLRDMLVDYRAESLDTAARAVSHAEGGARKPSWRYPVIALEWAARFYRDEAARVDWLLERLSQDSDEREVR